MGFSSLSNRKQQILNPFGNELNKKKMPYQAITK